MGAVELAESTKGFVSILFDQASPPEGIVTPPAYFSDLNLDQVENALTRGREEYRLEDFFRLRLGTADAVRYRQDVFRDVETPALRRVVEAFAASMVEVRLRLARAGTGYERYEQARWFLDAAREYLDGVRRLARGLADARPASAGLRGLLGFLGEHLQESTFTTLQRDADRVASDLERVRYNVWLRGSRITVAAYDDEPDLGDDIDRTFSRFQPDTGRRSPATAGGPTDPLDPLESMILEQVALVFPREFAALEEFPRAHAEFVDPVIARFAREAQFYLAYLRLIAPLRSSGLDVELPRVTDRSKDEAAHATFDLALALRLVPAQRAVITNDLSLSGSERIWVITGPNNGGKTTTARAIGQLHHLAALGCPVPGRDVSVCLVDGIFTHFERREDPSALTGKLGEELQRFAADFARATSRSLVIMNEMFSSTSASDAVQLSRAMLRRIDDLDALGVCVTFLDELAGVSAKAVSLVCGVDQHNPAIRTFRLERRPPDGRAYARALASKYGLTSHQIGQRVDS